MTITRFIKKIVICYFLIVLPSACSVAEKASTTEVANNFARAINDSDSAFLLKSYSQRFHVYTQQWSTATDGHGFTLTKLNHASYNTNSELSVFTNKLIKDLKLESIKGEYIPVETYSRFKEQFGTYNDEWKSRDAIMFLRGMGDVEHIVIIGVNRKSKKVDLFYYN